MKREKVEELKEKVNCGAVLEQAGFAVDIKESTRRAVKYRSGSDIIIVNHEGKGWFDPLSDAKGDVFSLVGHLDGVSFSECLERVGQLIGFDFGEPEWKPHPKTTPLVGPVSERWTLRRKPWRGSATWRYLSSERALPFSLLQAAVARDCLCEGPFGSMWAAHTDGAGHVTGWEERGPEWRGFATGGTKILFRIGPPDALRICVTEAAIDAMSLAAIEGLRDGTIYVSTGGGWSPTTEAAIRALVSRPDVQLVAATDANSQGETFAERLRALAEEAGCGWMRLRPSEEDWNEVLKTRRKERERDEKGKGLPHSRRPRQGKLRPGLAGP
ncbi:conserved hypothetical protein (plasmid) [Allorhizobium ampelinum S4]|uniref:DUF3991 domain-containing protein n=1 Tax=Allorhizobium ampelinum (strain ATCC BAA-846 / DSM 112012 / S4) TaxID=311402 RepID=B9K339_ALLAM|nr:DUF3991 and toprim domain-containing protein [Allorhizobium ampelinum]ACM39287.1 conserved hypothetical protein [Allorhizobium ampelinum S4]